MESNEVKPNEPKRMSTLKRVGIVAVIVLFIGAVFIFVNFPPSPTGNMVVPLSSVTPSAKANLPMQFFYAPGCHWCEKQIELFNQMGVNSSFEWINLEEHPEYIEEYQLRGTPAFRDPNTEKIIFGYLDKGNITELLKEA